LTRPNDASQKKNSVFRDYSGIIQGTFRERSGNIQGTFREHSGNIQGTFSLFGGVFVLRNGFT
jgi:hypothetical protein